MGKNAKAARKSAKAAKAAAAKATADLAEFTKKQAADEKIDDLKAVRNTELANKLKVAVDAQKATLEANGEKINSIAAMLESAPNMSAKRLSQALQDMANDDDVPQALRSLASDLYPGLADGRTDLGATLGALALLNQGLDAEIEKLEMVSETISRKTEIIDANLRTLRAMLEDMEGTLMNTGALPGKPESGTYYLNGKPIDYRTLIASWIGVFTSSTVVTTDPVDTATLGGRVSSALSSPAYRPVTFVGNSIAGKNFERPPGYTIVGFLWENVMVPWNGVGYAPKSAAVFGQATLGVAPDLKGFAIAAAAIGISNYLPEGFEAAGIAVAPLIASVFGLSSSALIATR